MVVENVDELLITEFIEKINIFWRLGNSACISYLKIFCILVHKKIFFSHKLLSIQLQEKNVLKLEIKNYRR